MHSSRRLLADLIVRIGIASMAMLGVTANVAFAQGSSPAFSTLHSLAGNEGRHPIGGLVEDANAHGTFYGTSSDGGDNGVGTIYKIDSAGNFSRLYSFTGGADGGSPFSTLIQGRDSNFYGTTTCGGAGNCSDADPLNLGAGTIFRITPGGTFTTLYRFTGAADGNTSYGGLVQGVDDSFYGITYCGGGLSLLQVDCLNGALPAGYGTTFKFSEANGLTLLHALDPRLGLDGCFSLGALTLGNDGNFYGTTGYCGGAADAGTLLKMTPGGAFTVLHRFTSAVDGGNPAAKLMQGPDGAFYGTTEFGGFADYSGLGTLFKFDPATSTFTTLYTFGGGADGGNPYGGVLLGRDGAFYGTTFYYSSAAELTGTVYRISSTGEFRTLYTFSGGVDGQNPAAGLVQGAFPDFALYGTTEFGPSTTTTLSDGSIQFDRGPGGAYRFTPPPILSCPANVVTSATSPAGASVTLRSSVIDPANKTVAVTWTIDGSLVQTDNLPASVLVAPISQKSMYAAGIHTMAIFAKDALGLMDSCTVTVEVDKLNQAITFAQPAAQTFSNGLTLRLPATSNSNLPVTFAITSTTPPGLATVSGNVVAIFGAGSITVTASQAGDGQYNPAPDVVQTFTVGKGNQTITFPGVPPQTFGAAPITFAATATSGLPVAYTIVSGPGTVSGSTLTITGAGTTAVKASQAGNTQYNAAPDATQNISVNKTPLTITTVAVSRNYGLANPTFTVSYAGFVNGSGPSLLTGTLTFSTAATSTSLPGAYPVTPAGLSSMNYAITFVPGTLTVLDIAPVAANDAATTSVGTAVTISVFANDAHAVGTLTITSVTSPAHGTAVISGQSIVYTPAAGYVGSDTFTYTENDGFGGSSTGTVTLTVSPATSQLGRFVAFSNDLTWLHEGATVATGDIGANLSRAHGHGDDHDHWSGVGHDDDDDDDDVTVRLDTNAIMQQTTSRVVGDTVELGSHSSIYGLIKNSLINHGGTILGTTANTMAVSYLTLPVFPSISAGTASVTVTKNTTKTLAPGNYGKIRVNTGGKLILTGGLYQILELDVDQSAMVVFKAAVDLRIKTSLNADTGSQIIVDPTVSGLRASQIKIFVASADGDGGCHNRYDDSSDDDFDGLVAVNIGENAVVKASIYAPNGTVWLKSRSQGTGAFIGQHVQVGPSAKLTLDSGF